MRRAKINDFVDIDRIVRAWQSHFTLSISPESLIVAFFSWAIHLADLPGKKTEILTEYLIKISQYFEYISHTAMCSEYPSCFEPLPHDERFSNDEWNKWPFNIISQGFLMTESCWQSATTHVHGLASIMKTWSRSQCASCSMCLRLPISSDKSRGIENNP